MTTAVKTISSLTCDTAPFAIRPEGTSDAVPRELLLDVCFGENRNARTCQRLRDGRLPAESLAFTAERQGALVGTVRLWHVSAGGGSTLVLGPLAVDPAFQTLGIGGALMRHAIAEAQRLGHGSIVLLGDAPYYERFGFSAAKAEHIALPGPFERERMLGLELRDGALAGVRGVLKPTGGAAARSKTSHFRKAPPATSRAA
ncbi:MAG: N-acetyltransferase [Alphaproteobacteria bacterium]|nr:MAG: N-acetyltransferase [Alphaproteobacteria bacterium]